MHNAHNLPIKTDWDLTLFYKDINDPSIEKDMRAIERACSLFERKFRGKNFIQTEKSLLSALQAFEKLHVLVSGAKPLVYFYYQQALNSSDAQIAARIAQLGERMTKAGNKIIFFDVQLSKTSVSLQKKYLASKNLAFYRQLLRNTFDSGKYTLTEPEERILSLKAQTDGMWVDGVDRALNKRLVVFKGKQVPINEAIPKIPTLESKADRDQLWAGILAELKTLHDFTESELNAFYTSKKISDELRGYKHPYDATLKSHEMDAKTVFTLVDAVNANMHIPKKFFALKKKLLKLDDMRISDLNAPFGGNKKEMSFETGYATVRDALKSFDIDFLRIFDRAFNEGHIDVYAKQGKAGGGFHSKTLGNPGVILLNYVPDFRSAFTLAHEVGHLVHSSLSEEKQKPLYQDYSTAAAEVASRFTERVYYAHILPTLSKDEQIALRMKVIFEDMNNIFHAITDFNVEHRFYTDVYAKGFVPFDEMRDIFVEENKKFAGDAVTITSDDGYRIIYISHFRLRYYLYSYAFGSIVARALFARVEQDPTFVQKVKQFLSAGSSQRPAEMFKAIGIDVSKPDFFAEGIKAIERDVAEFEKLVG